MAEDKKVGAGFGVMLLKDNKILLGKRNENKGKADSALHGEGTWTMPGGKLHFGESFEEGAIREVQEETGITISNPKVICLNNDKVEDAHFVTIGLIAENFVGNAQVMEPDEITEWNWFSLNELPSPLYFPSAKLIKNYKQNSFYSDGLKREFVSTVYLVKEGKILLTLNEKIKKWVPIGGHVEENELPHETAIREAKEESGFNIEIINLTNLGNINQNFGINLDVIKPDHHHINLSYIAKIKAGELKAGFTDDNTPLKWFSIDEINKLENIPDNVKVSSIKAIELMNNINL